MSKLGRVHFCGRKSAYKQNIRRNSVMKKCYEELTLEIVFVTEDVVRCSNTYSVGDDYSADIFD